MRRETDVDHCEWCGSVNPPLMTRYDSPTPLDARKARIPEMALCIHCAEVLSHYMLSRSEKGTESNDDLRSFVGHELESLLDVLNENRSLEAVTESYTRVRHVADKWMTVQVVIGDFIYSEVEREDAKRALSLARRITVQPASIQLWGDYEDRGRF